MSGPGGLSPPSNDGPFFIRRLPVVVVVGYSSSALCRGRGAARGLSGVWGVDGGYHAVFISIHQPPHPPQCTPNPTQIKPKPPITRTGTPTPE